MTAPRIVVSGATTAITRRTTYRKAFLGAWHRDVEACWLYALADAQRHTGVAVHHSVLVVSHHHTSVTPSLPNLPEFTRRFHRDLSGALHALLSAEKYDAPHELFDDRQAHHMRLLDAAAQASHLVYERLNPVAAGLVARPEHMPMRALHFGLWRTGFIEVERPRVYFDASRPDVLRLHLTPPPLLYREFGGDLDAMVYHLEKLVDDGARELRVARNRPPLGARALRRMHPWSEPRSLRESVSARVPTFKIGARDLLGRRAHIHASVETSVFRRDHGDARIARRDGDLDARFPYGTYAMRVHHGAPIEEHPAIDALVTAPGPTLDDVKAELAREQTDRGEVQARTHVLVDEVREVFRDEAMDVATEIDVSFVQAPVARIDATTTDEESAEPVVVRHRFDRSEVTTRAGRVVTLRDARGGRPRRGEGRGGDPPV